MSGAVRNLVLIPGDQLDENGAALEGLDPARDRVMMVESVEETGYIPQHRQRLVVFLSAMRHFRDRLAERGIEVDYRELGEKPGAKDAQGFTDALADQVKRTSPERIVIARPGDARVLAAIEGEAACGSTPLEVREDTHFIDTVDGFRAFAKGRKALRLEHYYRHLRRRHDVLMRGDEPVGERWNFDADNRERLDPAAAADLPSAAGPEPDALTREVMRLVEKRFPDAPGSLRSFDLPVTPDDAKAVLARFLDERLARFGTHQDAMVAGYPFLNHSRLSVPLNLHLIRPDAVVRAAVERYERDGLPLNAVEGFVRQVIGWREYVRGVYWTRMPEYETLNALDADLPMPAFMWTAETDMACVRDGVEQLIEHGYAHHIQRLMVLGQFAMLLGVHPYEVHRWHMSMYVDAVDWVSLPNVLGMSQYGDGGIVGSKPYCASGAYINRMGNYCKGCRYNPRKATGDDACPFTTLYWDFLDRHSERFKGNPRMSLQVKNVTRKDAGELADIRKRAEQVRSEATRETWLAPR